MKGILKMSCLHPLDNVESLCVPEVLQFSHLNLKRWHLSLVAVTCFCGTTMVISCLGLRVVWGTEELLLPAGLIYVSSLSYCAFVGRKRCL